jgi:MazG family protein
LNNNAGEAGEKFAKLVEIMSQLRAPGGCPWDRKQTFDTIKSYLLEESYEVMDAIDRRDWPGLKEELGDLLLQPVFFATIAAEQDTFTISDSLDAINNKLVRRHPHVFGSAVAETADDVKVRWDEVKRQEREEKGLAPVTSILQEVPRNVPALVEAEKISKKAAGAGFEWPDTDGVLNKIQEEASELATARSSGDREHIEHELGDLLFTVVNLARHLKLDPEQALRKANARFRSRFGYVEEKISASGGVLSETSLEHMDELWTEAKLLEQPPSSPTDLAEPA